MMAQRKLVSEASAIAKALDYSLKRWDALTCYLDDGHVPIDNNWVETRYVRGPSASRIGRLPVLFEPVSEPQPS